MSYNNNDSYKKYRDKVSMIAVLDELGYRAARGKGRGAPVMQLLDSNGNVIDEVVVFNPHNWAITNYWRRHSRPGFRDSGDVAQIIKDNIATMIFVEINAQGYIVYNIPENWNDITFNTTGLDVAISGYDYGHLVLSY